MENEAKITTFKELMDEVSYSWDHNYEIHKTEEGNYVLNKLYISPTLVTYKTWSWDLSPGVFEKFEKFMELLNEEKK